MATWIDACKRFAAEQAIHGSAVEALDAFAAAAPRSGAPTPEEEPCTGSFADLERLDPTWSDGLEAQLTDVDDAQAAMFARRLRSVDAGLGALGSPEARMLRPWLRRRTAGIRHAPPPRGIRIRALADFAYTLLARARLRAAGITGPPLAEHVRTAAWRTVAPGLRHAVLDGASDAGPLHVGLLEADPRRVRLSVADLRPRPGGLATAATAAGAAAATSGGFFLYSEPDIAAPSARYDPVGLLVEDGVVKSPSLLRRGALLCADDVELRRMGPTSARVGGAVLEGPWVTRAQAPVGPDTPSVAVVRDRVTAVGTGLPVPLNGGVHPCAGPVRVGDRVDWALPALSDGRPARHAVAGGPMLVCDGAVGWDYRAEDFWGSAPPVTFSQDETGDRNALPRLACGTRDDGTVVLAAIDGRNTQRALGMTLGEVAQLMVLLGCTRVLNLDGGSSKRMWVDGAVVDLASTEIDAGAGARTSVRPVHTAVLLVPR